MWPRKKQEIIEKPAKTAAQPRLPDGTFGPTGTAEERITPLKKAETEVKVVSLGVDLLTGINNLVKSQQDIINAAVAERLGEGGGAEIDEYSGLLATITPIVEALAPYIGPYVGPLLEKYAHVQPQNTPLPSGAPPSPPSPSYDAKQLIEGAAKTPASLLKAGMPEILNAIEKQGIERETFKRAIKNLNKAI